MNASIEASEATSVAAAEMSGSGKSVASRSSLSSSSAQLLVPKVAVVTPQRKEELLLKARAERRQWIEKVPLPYNPDLFCPLGTTMMLSHTSSTGTPGNDLWTLAITSQRSTAAATNTSRDGYNSLYKLHYSVLCQKYLPSATATISELYGLPTKSLKTAAETTGATYEPIPSIPLNRIQVAERVEGLVSVVSFGQKIHL
jgi:hypothetical protein